MWMIGDYMRFRPETSIADIESRIGPLEKWEWKRLQRIYFFRKHKRMETKLEFAHRIGANPYTR